MAAVHGWKYPPEGVPAEPEPDRASIPLSEAAERVGADRRTLLAAIKKGHLAGWARPGPGHLRWYVYEDALPGQAGDDVSSTLTRLEAENARLRAEIADLRAARDGDGDRDGEQSAIADLRARVVRAEAANLLLVAAHADLAAAAEKYRQALVQYMTPGHVGELTEGA